MSASLTYLLPLSLPGLTTATAPGQVTGTDVSNGNTCPQIITRTWTYTDACGNTGYGQLRPLPLTDTQAPVFAAAPADATYECIADVPAAANLAWTDNCDGPVRYSVRTSLTAPLARRLLHVHGLILTLAVIPATATQTITVTDTPGSGIRAASC